MNRLSLGKSQFIINLLLISVCLLGCPAPDENPDPGSGEGEGEGEGENPDVGPIISGFDFELSTGMTWVFAWDYFSSTSSPEGSFTSTDSGGFTVQLGESIVIDGVTAYAVTVCANPELGEPDVPTRPDIPSGPSIPLDLDIPLNPDIPTDPRIPVPLDPDEPTDPIIPLDPDLIPPIGPEPRFDRGALYFPRWSYLALAGNRLMGSTDGVSLQDIFDAQDGEWFGGGFFQTFPEADFFRASDGTISNDYLEGPILRVSRSSSQEACEIIAGLRICPNEDSSSFSATEFYLPTIGPAGLLVRSSSSFGGAFPEFSSSTTNVGLVDFYMSTELACPPDEEGTD